MAKHKFEISVGDKAGNVVGARCSRCGKIAEFEDHGQIPKHLQDEECILEDPSQAAVRIVREATENR
jgi:hypothetical protein